MLNTFRGLVKSALISCALPRPIRWVRQNRLTYLDETALGELYHAVKNIEVEGRYGVLIEAGCALGGSAIVIASAKSPQRPFWVYDVFGLIPSPTQQDGEDVHERYKLIKQGQSEGIDGGKYYGYENSLMEKVIENFERFGLPLTSNNIELIKGLFQNTLVIGEPVAFAHLDGDWYESVMTCLQRIEPHLIVNGVLIIDDYDAWSGCKKAVDEYFSDKQDRYEFVRKARLHIIRKS